VKLSALASPLLAILLTTAPALYGGEHSPPNLQRRLVVSGEGFFPVARTLQDGRIAVVLRGGADHVGIKGRLDIVFSADEGRTWSKPVVVNDSPADDRNPAFGQAKDGTLVVAFWRAAKDTYKDYESNADSREQAVNTWVTRSGDGGKTWSVAAEIDVRDIGYGSPYGKMLTLPDGSMLMNVYGYDVRKPGEKVDTVDHAYVYRSTDDGKTWARHGTIAKGFNESGLLALPDGSILAAMRSAEDKANVSVTRSTDGGKTWAEPKEVSGRLAHPADLVLLSDGRVLMVTGFRPGPFGVRGVAGDASGNFDWNKRFVIADDSTNSDTGYPSSVVLKDGRVLTFYYAVGSKTHPEWGVHCAVAEYRPPAK
jgi:hypothetical protein